MKKVVAFLEKYAEWVAMAFACAFLLYMVYAYVVSPDDLKVDVAGKESLPGDVDTYIDTTAVAALGKDVEAPATGISFPVPDFKSKFALAMSKDRDRMGDAFVTGNSFRPSNPGEAGTDLPKGEAGEQVTELPIPPVLAWTFSNQGNSLVSVPAPVVPGAAAPAAPVVNSVEKNWIYCEGTINNKAFAAAWKKALFNSKGNPMVPSQVLLTHFLKVEIERQEQIDGSTWSASIPVPPLAITEIKDYPKEGDREGQEDFRLWAEKHQVEIVEPTFYPVLHGDEWMVSAMKKEKEAAPGAVVDPATPFDPANPPNRPLTPQEKQEVYKYNLKQKQEKEKAENQSRKQKMDATRKPTPAGGGGEGTPRRKIGGYAPLPREVQRDDAGRIIRPTRPNGERSTVPGEGRGPRNPGTPGRLVNPAPTINNGAIQNQALSEPFDPTMLAAVDGNGKDANIVLWINDDSVVPGKTYRYRVRYFLKNPIYNTQALTKNQKFETQLAIASDWSEWSEVKAPSNTEYYFSRANQPINGKAITSVSVDVFRREKGDWYEATFTNVGPGDSIGSMKNKMDFGTGMTLVDLRSDTREKDTRILVSDEAGNIRVISFQAQLNDPVYASLKEKVKAAAAAGPAASADQPSLGNRVVAH